MKKFYMTIVAMLCGVAASAQTCTISAAESAIAVNAGDNFDIELLINQDQTEIGRAHV